MTYYINVNPDNLKDFLQIVRSLKNLGVIDSFLSVGELGLEGKSVSTEALLAVLEASKQEAREGRVMSSDEVKKQLDKWSQRPQ
jgi:hypothetical protein